MTAELRRVSDALAAKSGPTRIFFRDDDGGWADQQLRALGRVMSDLRVPLDIAVIPTAISQETTSVINDLRIARPGWVNVHQHGYCHHNYESCGRKHEFGPSRSFDQQHGDIERGGTLLRKAFGEEVDPIFTPPWNRCTAITVSALEALHYLGLSRISGSPALQPMNLCDLSANIDWLKKRAGERLSWPEFCTYASTQIAENKTVGVMLHHEHMDQEELSALKRFVTVLRDQADVSFVSMRELLEEAAHA